MKDYLENTILEAYLFIEKTRLPMHFYHWI
jgi:hypothetical protein